MMLAKILKNLPISIVKNTTGETLRCNGEGRFREDCEKVE